MVADLAGSVAIVTGGGRGIGRVLATGLAQPGAAVGLVARSADQLAETAHATGDAAAARLGRGAGRLLCSRRDRRGS